MFRYHAFGLSICSDVQLDGLEIAKNPACKIDLEIRKTHFGESIPPWGEPRLFDFEDPECAVMVWPGLAAVRVRGSELIEIDPFPDAPYTWLAFPLLGPVMGWLLHKRGMMVLHASTVVHRGAAIAFLGDKTAGKSTTATAFLAAGAKLLTDDLLALQFDKDMACCAMPAFAQVKLDATGPGAAGVPEVTKLPLAMEGFQKHQFRLPAVHPSPLPPRLIFVLKRGGSAPQIEWMDDRDAIAALIRFAYNVRFSKAPIEQQERARHFRQAVALLSQVRIGTLQIPHSLDRLHEVVDLIEANLGE